MQSVILMCAAVKIFRCYSRLFVRSAGWIAGDVNMPVNMDKPHLWKADIARSVDSYNRWFMRFAPKAYKDTRKETIGQVESALHLTDNLRNISSETPQHTRRYCLFFAWQQLHP